MSTDRDLFDRLALAAAGLLGAGGVAAAAGATHVGDTTILGALALVALTQAPAILALSLFASRSPIVRLATGAIALGALLFSADLTLVHFIGHGITMAAPAGGLAMIAGWLLLVVAAVFVRRS